MGIRNNQRAADPQVSRALTTPHGDQEQASAAETPTVFRFSLPLMGIRNRPMYAAHTLLSTISLPLMGIRNASRRTLEWRRCYSLTTPHGDQEPRAMAWSFS